MDFSYTNVYTHSRYRGHLLRLVSAEQRLGDGLEVLLPQVARGVSEQVRVVPRPPPRGAPKRRLQALCVRCLLDGASGAAGVLRADCVRVRCERAQQVDVVEVVVVQEHVHLRAEGLRRHGFHRRHGHRAVRAQAGGPVDDVVERARPRVPRRHILRDAEDLVHGGDDGRRIELGGGRGSLCTGRRVDDRALRSHSDGVRKGRGKGMIMHVYSLRAVARRGSRHVMKVHVRLAEIVDPEAIKEEYNKSSNAHDPHAHTFAIQGLIMTVGTRTPSRV